MGKASRNTEMRVLTPGRQPVPVIYVRINMTAENLILIHEHSGHSNQAPALGNIGNYKMGGKCSKRGRKTQRD
jgi:hypothetical protein